MRRAACAAVQCAGSTRRPRQRTRTQEEGTGDLLRTVAAEAQRGAPPENLREAERLSRAAAERRRADEIAMREAGTDGCRYLGASTRLRLGPPGWCDTGGWVWLLDGRVSDLSRITFDDGSEAWTSWLWRSSRACGICACEECGITQHPCACEHPPDPCRADWGPVPRLWLDIALPALAGVR